MVSPCGDDFFVGATFGRPHGLYKFKPCRFQKRAVEGASPYKYSGKFVVPQNRYALCGFTFTQGQGRRCRFLLRYCLYLISDFCVLFLIKSAPLGRLTPIEALPQTPQGTLSLDPASPLTPGPRLRFISRYARCCFFTLCLFFSLVSFAHSSLLIPHFTRFTA